MTMKLLTLRGFCTKYELTHISVFQMYGILSVDFRVARSPFDQGSSDPLCEKPSQQASNGKSSIAFIVLHLLSSKHNVFFIDVF